jgi:hypothetical protein
MEVRAMGKWGQSLIYTEPWPARAREKFISGCQGSRTQNRTPNRTPVRGLFWVGGEGGKNVRNQRARRSLKTVQAWAHEPKRV